MRPPDPEIPEDEHLYRGVAADNLVGGRLTAEAGVRPFVDKRGTSCQRSRYTSLDAMKARWGGVAATTRRQLPAPVQAGQDTKSNTPVMWEVFAFDNPSVEEGEGHVELRFRRLSDRPSTDNRELKHKVAKVELFDELARCFDLVCPPPLPVHSPLAPCAGGLLPSLPSPPLPGPSALPSCPPDGGPFSPAPSPRAAHTPDLAPRRPRPGLGHTAGTPA